MCWSRISIDVLASTFAYMNGCLGWNREADYILSLSAWHKTEPKPDLANAQLNKLILKVETPVGAVNMIQWHLHAVNSMGGLPECSQSRYPSSISFSRDLYTLSNRISMWRGPICSGLLQQLVGLHTNCMAPAASETPRSKKGRRFALPGHRLKDRLFVVKKADDVIEQSHRLGCI